MVSSATVRGIGGLLWHRDFRLLWTGETTRQFGLAVAAVAMSLVAVTRLHAGAFVGRATASARWLAYGAIAVGGLLAGSLATLLGLRAAVWVVTVAQVLFVTILLVGPIRRHRDLPATGRLAAACPS